MKNWTSILVVFLLGACGQKSEFSVDNASRQFCDCFNSKTTGTTDEKASPCLQNISDKKQIELEKSGVDNPDSLVREITKFSLDIMIDMVQSCDKYFDEINDLYDNGYPLDTTELNKNAIKELTIRIGTETNKDSVKSLLHKKVHKLIEAREFDEALQSIDSIKLLDNTDYGSNIASAYIFNQTGLHDKAILEIDRAIELSGNENLKLYAEVTKRKKQISKN